MRADLRNELARTHDAGTLKHELVITTPQSVHVEVAGLGAVLNMCANNYLGLANHPDVIASAANALGEWGFGMASVRFICGTQAPHRVLESSLSEFLGVDDCVLFGSCFDANGGLFEALLGPEDAIISDSLNHASIIDGVRLCKAQRLRFGNNDMDELERRLRDAKGARYRLIATDGVFSMDGIVANLTAICDLADQYDALVMVDDSHAVGVLGPTGAGTPELFDVVDRVDILTGTLGKAMGGGSGGYVAGRSEIVEMLRQRSRPYLFSNSLPPPVVAASQRALGLISSQPQLRRQLHDNTEYFRLRIRDLGLDVAGDGHPIVPVIIGDELASKRFSDTLLELGVYAVSFSYPVVPKGRARIRVQVSATHTRADLDFALSQFGRAQELVLNR